MAHEINAYLLPTLVTPSELAGQVVVVIDVLRATTTIIHALAGGARQILPCQSVEDARRAAAAFPQEMVQTGGERQGIRIEGFDLGNSPAEYNADAIAGKTIVFTTTNGTRALLPCEQARQVLLAGFVNASAVIERVRQMEHLAILCAGTNGQITREDTLLAGYLIEQLVTGAAVAPNLNDQARIALDSWHATVARRQDDGEPVVEHLARELRNTQGGRNLIDLHFDGDLAAAAAIDQFRVVPEVDLVSWTIH